MTLLGSTFLIYFLIGAGVAVAVYVSDMARTPAQRGFQTVACVLFWPLFLPLLLQRTHSRRLPPVETLPTDDELARAIQQVETELHAALQATDAFHAANGLLERLHAGWLVQAARIREMDRLLALPQYSVPNDAIQAERPILRDGVPRPEKLGGGSNAMC